MRIALFTETFLPATDGVVTRLRHTVEELGRAGDEVLVVAPRLKGQPVSYAGARVYGVPGAPFPPYPQIHLAPPHPGVGRAVGKFGPDVIHAVNPVALGVGGVYYAWRHEIPLVCSYHTNVAAYAHYYKLGAMVGFTRYVTRTLHNRARINLCTSNSTLDYLLDEGIKRVRLWPQGVDSRRFHPEKASREWRERLSGGEPEKRLVLFVGRLAPEKNLEQLAAVPRSLPGTRLAVVGDGPARQDLERSLRGASTVFTGLLEGEDLASAYASADAFLFTSTTETLGMAMLEALASGLPVIAARSGASGEVVEEGRSGLLYEPGSDASLVAATSRVLEDEELRASLSRGARAAAEERGWERATRTLRGYYEEARGTG